VEQKLAKNTTIYGLNINAIGPRFICK